MATTAVQVGIQIYPVHLGHCKYNLKFNTFMTNVLSVEIVLQVELKIVTSYGTAMIQVYTVMIRVYAIDSRKFFLFKVHCT